MLIVLVMCVKRWKETREWLFFYRATLQRAVKYPPVSVHAARYISQFTTDKHFRRLSVQSWRITAIDSVR